MISWPRADYREGLRAVLGVSTDAELGFRTIPEQQVNTDSGPCSGLLLAGSASVR